MKGSGLPRAVAQLLLFDPGNPRSLAYLLDRLRENLVSEPQIAALSEPQAAATAVPRLSIAETPVIAAARPLPVARAARKVLSPPNKVLAAKPKKETVAAVETVGRGLFRKKRDPIPRVALVSQRNTGLAAMVDRAIRGF